MKRILALVLALIMLLTLFSGCAIAEKIRDAVTETVEAETPEPKKEKTTVTTPAVEEPARPETPAAPGKTPKHGKKDPNTTAAPAAPAVEAAPEFTGSTLYIGYDPDFAPFTYDGENGKVTGFEAELARSVCDKLGMMPVFVPIEWDHKEIMLEVGDIDCVWTGLEHTPEREDVYCFTEDYFDAGEYMITLAPRTGDEPEYNIAVVDYAGEFAAGDIPDANVYSFPDNGGDSMMLALMLECGDMNAVIAPLTKIIEILTMLAEDGFAFDTAELECVMRSYFCVGFRKEDTDLRDAVNGAISSLIRSGEVRAVAEKFALVPDDFGMAIAAELGFPMSPILG